MVDNNTVPVSKRVKSLRQLTRLEKKLVRPNYKEACIKYLNTENTQRHIALKATTE
jgi:hypothetical protein